MITILRKELADYFTSIRFVVFFALILFASAVGLYAAFQGIRGASLPQGFVFLGLFTTSGDVIPSLISLIALLIPIIGIAFGFDAVNSERSGGTLSRLLAQPIYRDSVINGKFLAGIITLSIMVGATILIVGGYGLRLIGVTPTSEEMFRLLVYFIFTIVFGAFWMALAMLFSVLFRRIATSLLTTIGIWLFFTIFIMLIAPAIANSIVPVPSQNPPTEVIVRNAEIEQTIARISPNTLFSEATTVLLLPMMIGSLGVVTPTQVAYMLPNPLALGQSLLLVWPQLTSLIALTVIVFAISYVLFMRQEIRST